MDIYPNDLAEDFLLSLGIDYDALYNNRGGIQREQLKSLNAATFLSPSIVKNARQTIMRLEGSANKKGIDFDKNVKNTIVGTVTSSISDEIYEQGNPDSMIKWLPSSAEEQDIEHALNYGKTMKLSTAQKKGLGTRYGCKCGFQFVSDKDTIDKITKQLDI